MKANFKFNIGNRGLLKEEVGLAERLNANLRASAEKHGVALKPGAFVTVKMEMHNGKMVRQASARDKDPIEVPLAA